MGAGGERDEGVGEDHGEDTTTGAGDGVENLWGEGSVGEFLHGGMERARGAQLASSEKDGVPSRVFPAIRPPYILLESRFRETYLIGSHFCCVYVVVVVSEVVVV